MGIPLGAVDGLSCIFDLLFLIHKNYNVKKSGKHVAKNTSIFLVKR